MRCSVCQGSLSLSVVSITVYGALVCTMTICHRCQATLWGDRVTERIQRLANEVGWKQPPLPVFG